MTKDVAFPLDAFKKKLQDIKATYNRIDASESLWIKSFQQ
jgi:hypothetical protein